MFFATGSPFIGYVAGAYSLNTAIFCTALVGGTAAILLFLGMLSRWKEIAA